MLSKEPYNSHHYHVQPQDCIHKFSTKIIHVTDLQCLSFSLNNSAGIFVIVHDLIRFGDVDFSNLKGHDECILFLMEESHLAVGGWIYIETPARKIALSHT